MRRLHAHEEMNPTENLDDNDRKADPGNAPSPFHLGIGEEGDDSDEEWQEDDAHGGRLESTSHHSRDPPRTTCLHLDGIKEEVERDCRKQQAQAEFLESTWSAAGFMHGAIGNIEWQSGQEEALMSKVWHR